MFSVGDLVVHPMHGAGVIHEIVQERIAGKTQTYYVFQMPVGGLRLLIPVANSDAIGIRPIMSAEEAAAFMEEIPLLTVETDTNWNRRYRENLERLKSGDLRQVARVIKSLMHRERRRSLSTGERKMLHAARQVLLSELVLASGGDYDEIARQVDCAMMQEACVGRMETS